MAQRAVGVDEVDDGGLLGGGWRGGAVERGLSRRDTGRLAALTELEAFEEHAPRLVHGLGIATPALILLFENAEIQTGGESRAHGVILGPLDVARWDPSLAKSR